MTYKIDPFVTILTDKDIAREVKAGKKWLKENAPDFLYSHWQLRLVEDGIQLILRCRIRGTDDYTNGYTCRII